MLHAENTLYKMASLVFISRYFDFSGFLEVVWNNLREFYFQAQEAIILLANIDYIEDNVIQLTFQGCEIFVTYLNEVKTNFQVSTFSIFVPLKLLSQFSIINLMFLLEVQQPHG